MRLSARHSSSVKVQHLAAATATAAVVMRPSCRRVLKALQALPLQALHLTYEAGPFATYDVPAWASGRLRCRSLKRLTCPLVRGLRSPGSRSGIDVCCLSLISTHRRSAYCLSPTTHGRRLHGAYRTCRVDVVVEFMHHASWPPPQVDAGPSRSSAVCAK